MAVDCRTECVVLRKTRDRKLFPVRPVYLWPIVATLFVTSEYPLGASPLESIPDDVPKAQPVPNGSPAPTRRAVFGKTQAGRGGQVRVDGVVPQQRREAPPAGAPVRPNATATSTVRTRAGTARTDVPVRRVQATASDINTPNIPNVNPLPAGVAGPSALAAQPASARSIALEAALYGALTGNPDLVTLRQGNALAISAEAVEVARNFPTTLNPTLWIDYRPIALIPTGTFGSGTPGGHSGLPGATISITMARIISTFHYVSRSSWAIRRRTATESPRPRMSSRSGSSSRPSWRRSCRLIAFFRPRRIAAISTTWPGSSPTSTTICWRR